MAEKYKPRDPPSGLERLQEEIAQHRAQLAMCEDCIWPNRDTGVPNCPFAACVLDPTRPSIRVLLCNPRVNRHE